MLLTRLREVTGACHHALEHRLDLLREDFTRAEYAHVLRQMRGYYGPLEGHLAAAANWTGLGFDFERRRKTPLLDADLKLLGADAPPAPECPDLPAVGRALGRALGCMYVLEGATLGGQLVARHARRTLGLTPANGGAFFTSYGNEISAMWRQFGAFVTARVPAGEEEAAIATACDVFRTLDAWVAATALAPAGTGGGGATA